MIVRNADSFESIERELRWPGVELDWNNMHQFSNSLEASFPAGTPVLGLGDLVRVHGLQSPEAQQFNGKLGQVIAVHHTTRRFGVSLYDWEPVERSIRAQNLTVQPLTTSTLIKRALAWYVFWFAEMEDEHFM